MGINTLRYAYIYLESITPGNGVGLSISSFFFGFYLLTGVEGTDTYTYSCKGV